MICLGVSPDGVGFFFVVVVDDDVTVSLKGFTSINVKVRAETRHDFFFLMFCVLFWRSLPLGRLGEPGGFLGVPIYK